MQTINAIKELTELIELWRLSKIEVIDGDNKIRLSRDALVEYPGAASQDGSAMPGIKVERKNEGNGSAHTVTSNIVGIARTISDDFNQTHCISIGQKVRAGDKLLEVEAMKIRNPVTSVVDGVVTAILVWDGQPIEYGQPLVTLAKLAPAQAALELLAGQ